MTTRFSTPWQQPDLDIHSDPAEGWHRVAVVGLWTDAKVLRRDWPHAAVVGPLRTLRGIDMLIRSLLANPQIRVLVVTGRDLSPGASVRIALEGLWGEGEPYMALSADIREAFTRIVKGDVELLDLRDLFPGGLDGVDFMAWLACYAGGDTLLTSDRPGGAIILPPPPPPENPELPAGLPGQRITETLADVWPKVLQEVLRFGDQVPTIYGGSRELLNLVSVIEDPKASLAEFGRGGQYEPTPEGMAFKAPPHPILGISWADLDDYYSKSFMGETPPEGVSYTYGSRLHGVYGPDELTELGHVDQVMAVRSLLQAQPGTRAAYLTPWNPGADSGKESGRPCWTGALFRAVPGGGPVDAAPVIHLGTGGKVEDYQPTGLPRYKLHLTVTFRSHDMHGAYPLSLAACCRWLCEEAKALNMEVGTVTCVSMSAHVYDHALEAAGKVVSEHVKPGAWSQDPRSAWRVWLGGVPSRDDDGLPVETRHTYHAEASDPAGTRVLQAFEAPTKERLIRDIQASGLVSSVQHAIWLGAEVGKL